MLTDLHIRNLAVLEEATIELAEGFNVLSGETGAGKSIVVDSLALLAGVRASHELIRTGAESLSVTGVFRPGGDAWRQLLAAAGLDTVEDELVVRREISRNGRNRAFIDDRPVTVKLLTELAPRLLRIHGQRQELGLIDPELQRTWLDRSGGATGQRLLAKARQAFEAFREIADHLDRLTGDERLRQERVDLLRFQLSEISAADLRAGEEDELRQERDVLRNSGAILDAIDGALSSLYGREEESGGGSSEGVSEALHALDDIASWEPEAAAWITELREIEIRLSELEPSLRRRLDGVDAEPGRLDAVEDRLAALERLFRKYGPSSAEIQSHAGTLELELAELEDADSGAKRLHEKMAASLDVYRQKAGELSSARAKWAKSMAKKVRSELSELSLDKARFEIALETRARASSPLQVGGSQVEFSALGYDAITYRFSPNPGEDLQPLGKVASGGELSRLFLAVQLASDGASERSAPTLVFDEVDAGLGGAEAAVLGSKLRRLAAGGQILAVTHLPQVASYGDVHFQVSKAVSRGRTHTRVRRLGDDDRIEEVARMLAGSEITELSLDHARELIGGA